MATPAAIDQALSRLLAAAPSFAPLDPATRATVHDSLAKITSYLAADPLTVERAFGPPDPLAAYREPPPSGGPGTAPAGAVDPGSGGPTGAAPSSGGGTGTTGRVGDLARATLNAIDFPSFVASLIQGTFQAIVDASIQQMEAYAELLKNVASTVDRFMNDNVTDGTAKDYLADQYGGVVAKVTSGGTPRLTVNRSSDEPMPSFFSDLGFTSRDDLDDASLDQVAVPAARRQLAQQRQQTLATMVLLGINRVVVDDGEITAKLQFHIDAAESADVRFNQTKTTGGNMASRSGRSPFTANAVMVNTTTLNAQSDINIRTDLTGQVTVKFRSETFPLQRFADSAAIQLINSNASVPQQAATPEPPAATTTAGTVPVQSATAPMPPTASAGGSANTAGLQPMSPPISRSAGQSLSADDPWLPDRSTR